jgi:LPS-assembly protein
MASLFYEPILSNAVAVRHLPPFVALAVVALLPAWASANDAAPALRLQMSQRLEEHLGRDTLRSVPSFVYGNTLTGQTGVNTLAEGHAELRRHDTVIRADRLEHQQQNDTATATGHVRVTRSGDVFEGPELHLKLDTSEGHFLQPRFTFLRNGGQGDASRVDFIDEDRSVAHHTRYSTCPRPPGGDWLPAWLLTASRVEFDNATETGTATNGVLSFLGVPLLASPWVSFPLSDKRKSGWLTPTIGVNNRSGLEVSAPYYLNLAPNRDATLTPTVMTRRGIDLGGEYRYLDRQFSGQWYGSYMPSDKLYEGSSRWSTSVQHQHTLTGLPGLDSMGLRLNVNRVSDDNYWRDFSRANIPTLAQRLLPTEAVASWGRGPFSVSAGTYTWQALGLTGPYDRLPSIGMRYSPGPFEWAGSDGWEALVTTDFTRFQSNRALGTWDGNGDRAMLQGHFSKTWQAPGWYVKPGVQLNLRQYQFEQAFGARPRSQGYAIPSVHLDSGLFFERDTSYFGRDFVQTLEPRLYYARTPYRDQSFLPLYDTAAYDFNLATIFLPTPYAGHDRIADANLLTLGATTRLLDPDSGAEMISLGVAQRVRFSEQRVTLPNQTMPEGLSDILFGAKAQITPHWSVNGTVQYAQKSGDYVRTTLGTRYSPGNYRVFNAAYRLKQGVSEQLDLGWQWPLADLFGSGPRDGRRTERSLAPGQWYSVGRINYSVPERRIVDLIAGFEYDAGCWIGRVVMDRLQNSLTSTNQRIMFQLEFSGFTRVGSSPLKTLKENIPRYQYLREDINPPSRFERYE